MPSKLQTLSVLILLSAAIPAWAQNTEIVNGHPAVAGRALLKLRAPSTDVLNNLRVLADADDFRQLGSSLNLFVLHSRSSRVAALLALLKAHPAVAYAEPDYILKGYATPSDPSFPQQWSFYNTSTLGADIGATPAWDISTGSIANVVGVVDTGVDYTHPDLAANMWTAPTAFTINLSWGPLTCPAGSHGYNAITRTCDPRDDHYHGTHVSGTIGAVGNNAIGVAGVNWTTRIMGIKFLGANGSGSTSDAIDAIEFAIQAKLRFAGTSTPANVRVLSNSWGGGGYSQALLDEINKANTNDMLFVVAAGNNGTNIDITPQYPAAFNAPNLISVAATTSTDALASFSNWGLAKVHMGAPGVGILSTTSSGSYGYLSGTSMAVPHVAGAATLLLSRCELNTAGLKNALLSNVDPLASLESRTVTGGRLNVYRAIQTCAGVVSSPGTASFVRTDLTTQGSWRGVYGTEGYNVIQDAASYPTNVTVAPGSVSSWTWAASTTDVRGLQKAASATDRIAGCWYTSASTSFTVDINFSDSAVHQLAAYFVDWDANGRNLQVRVLDGNTNSVLDTRSLSNFINGAYLVWNLTGHVKIQVTNIGGINPVLSGLFFGGSAIPYPPPPTATFVQTDATTKGNWKGVYGADGYNVIQDSVAYPTYATVAPGSVSSWTWAASTTDVRGLQKAASATDRIAGCWYTSASTSFTVDINLSDSAVHQFAAYFVDWDANGRNLQVRVLDGNTNSVLDTRSLSNFINGAYLVWNLTGHVKIEVTNIGGVNPVLSGLFFR